MIECLLKDFSLKDLKRNRKEKEDHYTESVKSLNHLFSSNTMVGMMKIMIFSDNLVRSDGVSIREKRGGGLYFTSKWLGQSPYCQSGDKGTWNG